MFIELKDIQSGKTLRLDAPGKSFGREGGAADQHVPDRTVSSLHARISNATGSWVLEDLNSSNGTFVRGERITAPVRLEVGLKFALCRYAFEVAAIDGATATEAGSDVTSTALGSGPLLTGPTRVRTAGSTDPGAMPGLGPGRTNPPQTEMDSSGVSVSSPSNMVPLTGEREALASSPSLGAQDGLGLDGSSDLSLMTKIRETLPGAFGYYLSAIPALVASPAVAIRRTVEDQRFPPFGPGELAAYGLPATALGLVPLILGTIVSLGLAGAFGVSAIVSLVIQLVIFAAISIATAFLWHPVVGWLITLLGGTSDAKSRSNYYVAMFTAVPLLYAATGIGLLVSALPIPFVGVFGLLLSIGGVMLSVFIAFVWLQYFRVHKVVPLVVLVLGAASCVMYVLGIVDVVRADVARLSSPGPASVVTTGDASSAEAIQAQLAALAASGNLTPEVEAALKGQLAATSQKAAPTGLPAPATEPTPASMTATAGPTGPSAKTGKPAPPTMPTAGSTESQPVVPTAGSEPGTASAGAAAHGATGYVEWAARRDALDKLVDRDPTVLNRKGVLPMYRDYLKRVYKARDKFKKKGGKRGEDEAEAAVNEKLRAVETYETTKDLVDKLYGKLFP